MAHENEPQRRYSDKWHVGKEIPLAIIAALLFQTIGAIWWLSQLSFKLDNAITQLQEFKADRYTRADAQKDRELFQQLIDAQRQRDAEHDRRLEAVEKARVSLGVQPR